MEQSRKMFKLTNVLGVFLWLLLLSVLGIVLGKNAQNKPNIILMMADDLGSHDVSLRGSNQILTPNIDALGYQGVIFNRHYTAALCSPSRSALMTGKYSIHTGMQYYVIAADEARSVPLSEKLLPQYLKEAGYKTHMAGKWHLGMAKKAFTPTHRGFDSHVGYLVSQVDYFDFTFWLSFTGYERGFDFRYNESVYRDRVGEYLPDVLADEASKIIYNHDPSQGPLFLYYAQIAPHAGNDDDPLQAIPEDLMKVGHIKDPKRRTYAAMVKALDRSVGTVVKALKEKGMLENSIIVFFSDNGGPTEGFLSLQASNYPLRGQKDGPWEGSLRGMALAWSPLLRQRHRVSDHLTHITDWLPTFAQIAGVKFYRNSSLDGDNIWDTLSYNKPPNRREMVHNIDPITGYSSIYFNGWKYINGTTNNGEFDSWLGDMPFEDDPEAFRYPQIVMESDVWRALNPFARKRLQARDLEGLRKQTRIVCQKKISQAKDCNPLKAPCLFYIQNDPCEVNNLADLQRSRVKVMEERLRYFQKTSVPAINLPHDPAANPALNGGLMTWWLEKECSK
ncbi:arylsulfatase B-like [Phlebotomus argentipes]|uniref:arylsulfatase B-like n=1 Tax=Phlebotomus argentipes TaxID=94469 RepID=UPI0028930A5D|nr:arylsulfatase B-like [Phlebotomus argentipes]